MKDIIIGITLVFLGVYFLRFAKRTPKNSLKMLTPQSYILGILFIIIGIWDIIEGLCELC